MISAAFHNLRAGGDGDVHDDAGERRPQRVLHLHGFDDGKALTAGYQIAGAGESSSTLPCIGALMTPSPAPPRPQQRTHPAESHAGLAAARATTKASSSRFEHARVGRRRRAVDGDAHAVLAIADGRASAFSPSMTIGTAIERTPPS